MIAVNENEVNVMVDLETLGLTPDSMILSIGAVVFDPVTNTLEEEFYAEIDIRASGRFMDPITIMWWFDQAVNGNHPTVNGTTGLYSALCSFNAWLSEFKKLPILWANGTDFDIPILYNACKEELSSPAWKYNDVRDARTIFKLFGNYGIKPTNPQKHHALEDAKFQATWLMSIFSNLNEVL
jgi:hypothetical protein